MKVLLFLLTFLFLPFPALAKENADLPVPHIWEIPGGVWVPPWSGACEEASMMMVERFYLGDKGKKFTLLQMKNLMQPLFPIEDRLFGSNLDTNAERTLKVINDHTSFDAKIKKNPTVEEIKAELEAGRPVISLHYGFDLKNPLHRWRQGGSSYHMMVIKGFDDETEEFITNDPELRNGLDFRYTYDIIMNSLHDFNHTTKKANGEPVVLFTQPKQIVRGTGRRRVFVVRNNVKHLISNPTVFKNHRWSWELVQTVDTEWLDNIPWGDSINK